LHSGPLRTDWHSTLARVGEASRRTELTTVHTYSTADPRRYGRASPQSQLEQSLTLQRLARA